jgi:hypothetical protein
MTLRVPDATGTGTELNIIKAINYARKNGATIINASCGLDLPDQAPIATTLLLKESIAFRSR